MANRDSFYRKYGKRILDFIFAVLCLIVFAPLFVIVAILVRIKLGSPVLFSQKRPGKNNAIFKMYKFRTMKNAYTNDGHLLPDDIRLTSFGRLLRKTSLDELPELINVLRGEMSFVGPRPLLVEYLPFYSEKELQRHECRPGITGLAQVKGRNAINWETKFKYDIEYVNSISFMNDLKILIMTIKVVFFRENILVGQQHIAKRLDDERRTV